MRKILSLVILAAPVWAGWVEKYRLGESLLGQGKSAIAVEHLQGLAKEAEAEGASKSQLAAVYDALGRAEMGSGRYRDGKRHFETALLMTADGPLEAKIAVTANLGQACQNLGELVHAERLFHQALAAAPQRAALLNLLGGVLYLQHRYGGAEDAFGRALLYSADLDSVTARTGLAAVYQARGKFREAAGLYEQAISGTPAGQARARLLANLGSLQLKLGNPVGALAILARSLDEIVGAVGPEHPDVAHVLEIREQVLRKLGRKTQAIDAAQRAKAIRSSFIGQDNATQVTVDYLDLKK